MGQHNCVASCTAKIQKPPKRTQADVSAHEFGDNRRLQMSDHNFDYIYIKDPEVELDSVFNVSTQQ